VPHLDQRGIPLVAISPQKPDGSLSMREKNELTFTVLSDAGNQVAAGLGVLGSPSDDCPCRSTQPWPRPGRGQRRRNP